MIPKTSYKFTLKRAILAGLVILLLNACSLSLFNLPELFPPTATPSYPIPPTPTPQPQAEVNFNVTLPAPLLPNEMVNLSVVDEVSGLAMNAISYPMTAVDALHYTVTVPFAVNSVVKYRYIRQSTLPTPEDDPLDRPVRYRMFHVATGGVIQDLVASWTDSKFTGPIGRVTGTVTDPGGIPLTNILVVLGGAQTLTDSSGTFIFDAVLPGTQNLVAYAMDGTYTTFQQGVVIAADKRTRPVVTMSAAPMVSVIFTLIVPAGTAPTVPVRMAGNLLQLGNTFADLNGGLSTVASRMPVLAPLADGRFSISLSLPAGADLRYKYTLGDGFWNAEHLSNGAFVLRQLVVPPAPGPVMISDMVETWQAGPSAPITFEATVPANTPIGDIVSIQFNPYGWTEPVPMWPLGGNRWAYTLYSPLNMLGTFEYRYCRNDQCEAAGDMDTLPGHSGRLVSTSLIAQDMQDVIAAWNWMQPFSPAPVVGVPVTPRTNFWAGIEFQTGYDPTWQAWMPAALQDVQGRNANWVVLSPTWTSTRNSPPSFLPLPGMDPLWNDSLDTINRAHASNLSVALFPSANFTTASNTWWASAARDADWWNAWFERYQAFTIYHADLASKTSSQALILGGEWVSPALSNGLLPQGGSSNVPADADARWAAIISAVRQHYVGPLFWALPYNGTLQNVPAFLSSLDGIYILWNAPLSTSTAPAVTDMEARAGQLMDADLLPLANSLQKPMILAAAYPSITGSANACIPDGQGGCRSLASLNQPAPDDPALAVSLSAQADIVQALLGAVNARAWVGGFVSRGYYPPVALFDKSASVHGKPAADVLWYWYPKFLGR